MDEIDETILRDYVATANNPEYNVDWDIINSKFPELKDVDKQLLKDYVATANNPEYNGDYSIVNSKFPELFEATPDVKKKEQTEPTQPVQDAPLQGIGGVSEEPTPSPSVGQEPKKSSGYALDLSKITPELISLEEDEAISFLEKNYSKLGFQFEKAGFGDAVRVKKNGNEEVFDFDPWTSSTEVSEAERMKKWMTENSTQDEILHGRHAVREYANPNELEVNVTDDVPTEEKEVDSFDRKFEQFAGPSQKLMVSGVDTDAIKELNRQKEEEAKKKEAMRMAVGKADGSVVQEVSGFEEGIFPGQDIIISNKIEAKKAKSSESHWDGGDNYYANVYLNYLDETSPNQANDLRSRIENDNDFFNKQKTDLKSPSAEVVKGGLDIVLGVTQDNYVSASENASGIVDQITELEPQLEKHLDRIDGKSYNGTPEQFQEYSDLTSQINQLSDSQEMRELRMSIDALDSTYRDYETNPDVNILDAYETIKGNYQRQVDATYFKNSFVSDLLTPITDGVMRSGLGLVSNVASLVNNINADNEWGTTDDIAAWAKGAADTYDLRNPAPSKFSRDFYEEVAVVGDYEVELKGGKPTGRVFGSNGYLAQTDITENILKQYNDEPELYDKETNYNIRSGLYSSTEVGMDMVMGLIPVAGIAGKGFKVIGASETLAATLGMSTAIVVQSQDEFVQMAKDAGANDQEALAFGMAQSAAIAAIASINPIEAKALMRMTGSAQKSLAKKYVQNIVGGMSRKDAAAEVTKKSFLKTISKIRTKGKTVLKEGGKEGLEEILEIPAGDIISNGWQTVGGVNTYTETDIAEYINTFFLAGAGSLPFAFLGLSGDVKTNSKKELTYSATQNIDTVRKLFEENLGKKIKDASGKEVELTQEYIDEHIGQLEELSKMSEVYFSNKNLTEADKTAITDLLSRKRSFDSKTTDDVSKNTFKSIIDDINSSLNEYLNKGSKTPFYVINGVAMNKQQVEERLSDEDFVAGLRNGRIDVRIKNDKETQSRFNNLVKGKKRKGRLTKFSTPQDGIVGEVAYEDGTRKELTQEEYDALEKQEGLFDVVVPTYKDDRLSKLDELEKKDRKLAKEAGYDLTFTERLKRIFTDPLERKEGKALDELSDVEDDIYDLKREILIDIISDVGTENELNILDNLSEEKSSISESIDNLLDKENKTKSDKKKIDELNDKWNALNNQSLDIEEKLINRYREQQTIQDDVEAGTQPVTEAAPVDVIEERVKVFRGKGNNFAKGVNEGMVWVAESESVAKNYASINDDGSFNVEEKEILKPKNTFELPYKFNTDVRSSNIGDNLREATKIAMDKDIISKEEVSDVLDMIDKYEKEAGDNLEPYHTKINKPNANKIFAEIVSELGYDAVLIKEGGSNTYGLITKPKQETVPAKAKEATVAEPVSEASLEDGRVEITNVKSGTHTSTKPIKIFKGIGGKKDLKGARINAHKGAEGVFTAVDKNLAEDYARGEGVSETVLPEGTTFEVVEIDGTGMTPGQYRDAEVKAINESKADVVKLITVDGKIKAGTKKQEQYVIKNEKLIEDAIQEQEAADVPKVEQPEAVQEVEGEVREPAREAEEAEKAEITEEEKVKAAKDNLNNVWENWKQSQKNLGVAFDPKSKANEDMELLEAFVSYIQAIGAKTAKDIQKAFNDFTGGEATLDEAGAEFVAESVKEPVTKKTDKELSREVTFTNIYDIIEKVEKRTPKKANPKEVNKRAYQNAYDYLLKSDWFASATDTEQTEAIDDLKKLTKQRRESSPSAKKILGIDSTKEKISVDQKTVRSWMMQDLAKGYKLGKRDAKKVMAAMTRLKNSLENELVGAMREIQSSGKLSKKQVDAIVNKFQKTNVFNPDAVESFLNYMQKVVDKADYVDAVSKANSTRKQIKRRMKNKDVDNNLVQAAKEFAKINPSKVDDIEAYNQLAEKIKEGLGFSMNSKQGVKFRSAFDISTVEEYSELELKRQKLASDAAFEEMFKDMFGSDLGMTVSQMRDFYAELDKETEKDEVKDKETRAKKAMDSAVKAFDTYSAIINEMLESGVDSFTGEKLDIDSKTEELIKEFMDSDVTKLPLKDAIRAVDALNNFVVNQTTGGLEAIVRKRRGEGNVKKLVNDGVKSFKLKLPFGSGKTRVSNLVGAYLNSFASLPNLMDNLFGGVRKALKVENAIGFSDVVNGRAAANKKANQVLEQFLDKFKSKKANNEDFNTAANMTERGLLGFMRRTSLSTDEKLRKAEFERRKNLIKESIEKMMKFGDEADFNKAQIYMEAYNKLLEDSNSIEDVESKADPVNKEAVEWWSEKFNEILPELTETSINVYNTVLENESNYNPDVFKRLNEQESELTGLDEDSYNSGSGNQKVYDKKNPMLMRVKKPSSLPKGRYVSLDFDVNNFNSYESALVDINTASAIQQLKGALESDAFMQLVPDYRDRKILKDRITTYVSQIRGKGGIPRGELWNEVNRIANMFSRVGTATSLGGLLQPAKQTLPVFVNTLVNSGMDPRVFQSIAYVFNKDISNAINNSGMPIANRGALSETTLDDIDKLSDKLEETKGEGLYNGIKILQDMWMKKFLQKPDAFIARASFLVYYKQELKRKGIDTSKIDWKNHKWNKDAANFAQRMVDRQQNVSDSDLQGLFLTERGGAAPIIRKILLPFQNFVLNQKNRMYADVKALRYGSKEDKSIAIKSLLGLSAEWASFTIISMGIQEGMYMTAEALISQFKGDEDDEEAKKKRAKERERRRKMYIKSMTTSAAKDFLSPLPVVDEALITALNYGLEESGASIDKGDFEFGVDFDKSMYEEYEKEVLDISDEELKLDKSIEYLNYMVEAQKEVDGEMYDVHKQKINEFDERLKSGMEYQSRIRKDVERYMKKIEVKLKPFQLYEAGKTNKKLTDMLGSVGIAIDRVSKTQEMFKQAGTLEYETESFGKKTVKRIPKELQPVLFIAAGLQLGSTTSVFPSELASTSNKIQKLVQKEAKTESQLEAGRKDDINKLISEKSDLYKGYESGIYSAMNAHSLREYKKRITEMTDDEVMNVMKEMGY